MSQKISDHIYNNRVFGNIGMFCEKENIDKFFEDMPDAVSALWPFDLSEKGFETEYLSVNMGYKQAGYVKTLHVQAAVSDYKNSRYEIVIGFDFDGEKADVEIESFYKSAEKSDVPDLIIDKLKMYVYEIDKQYGNEKAFDVSKIKINAKSGLHKKNDQELFGGYVWANYGFDFDDVHNGKTLLNLKEKFKNFCTSKGVSISDKELNLFTKPCHFSGFDCGVKVVGKNGKETHIGNAFMAEQSWYGKWDKRDIDSIQEKYSKAYNNKNIAKSLRRRHALMLLGKPYANMLKKHSRQKEATAKNTERDKSFIENLKLINKKLFRAG